MGSGKTVFGRKLARKLGYRFADLDNIIETNYTMTIPGIFSRFDETVFRTLESKELRKFVDEDNLVLSCGGGTPCYYDNMEFIKENGVSIYIKLNEKSLSDRLIKSKTKRPLIEGLSLETLQGKIGEMLDIREHYYSMADIVVDGINLKEEEVLKLLNNLG